MYSSEFHLFVSHLFSDLAGGRVGSTDMDLDNEFRFKFSRIGGAGGLFLVFFCADDHKPQNVRGAAESRPPGSAIPVVVSGSLTYRGYNCTLNWRSGSQPLGVVAKAPPARGDGASWWVVQAAGSIAAASG